MESPLESAGKSQSKESGNPIERARDSVNFGIPLKVFGPGTLKNLGHFLSFLDIWLPIRISVSIYEVISRT